jgi:hypothetical protein
MDDPQHTATGRYRPIAAAEHRLKPGNSCLRILVCTPIRDQPRGKAMQRLDLKACDKAGRHVVHLLEAQELHAPTTALDLACYSVRDIAVP